jgi:hypothetical protein
MKDVRFRKSWQLVSQVAGAKIQNIIMLHLSVKALNFLKFVRNINLLITVNLKGKALQNELLKDIMVL